MLARLVDDEDDHGDDYQAPKWKARNLRNPTLPATTMEEARCGGDGARVTADEVVRRAVL